MSNVFVLFLFCFLTAGKEGEAVVYIRKSKGVCSGTLVVRLDSVNPLVTHLWLRRYEQEFNQEYQSTPDICLTCISVTTGLFCFLIFVCPWGKPQCSLRAVRSLIKLANGERFVLQFQLQKGVP
jgi:hypothetical protein